MTRALGVSPLEGYERALMKVIEAMAVGTPFEEYEPADIFELARTLRERLGEEERPRNELALYVALRREGVPHRAIIQAFERLPLFRY